MIFIQILRRFLDPFWSDFREILDNILIYVSLNFAYHVEKVSWNDLDISWIVSWTNLGLFAPTWT